jgi:hypothetical protein
MLGYLWLETSYIFFKLLTLHMSCMGCYGFHGPSLLCYVHARICREGLV